MRKYFFPLAAFLLMPFALLAAHINSYADSRAQGKPAEPFLQKAKLRNLNAAVGDNFGFSVVLNAKGDTALIGAYEKNGQHGAAYVFTRIGETWTQQQELTPADKSVYAFGWSVALSGDGGTALIGAIGKDARAGSGYVFTRSGTAWVQQQKLKASDGAGDDNFGFSLALAADGNTVLIGAPGANSFKGRVYIFTRSGSTWTQQQELANPDGSAYEEFASAVALSADGGTALIGAYEKNRQRGTAYIFTRSGPEWTERQELSAFDNAEFDAFGWSVALSGDGGTALVGAIGKKLSSGAAYVFMRSGSTWAQQWEFTSSDKAIFGTSLALNSNGSAALIGANGHNGNTGIAYLFTRTGPKWSQQQALTAADGSSNNDFGVSVALSSYGNAAIIGSLANAAYPFMVPYQIPDWNAIGPYVKTLLGLANDGSGIGILPDGVILHFPPSGSHDPILLTLDQNFPQVLRGIQFYQSTLFGGAAGGSDAVKDSAMWKERKKALDMTIEALKNMLHSLQKLNGQEK